MAAILAALLACGIAVASSSPAEADHVTATAWSGTVTTTMDSSYSGSSTSGEAQSEETWSFDGSGSVTWSFDHNETGRSTDPCPNTGAAQSWTITASASGTGTGGVIHEPWDFGTHIYEIRGYTEDTYDGYITSSCNSGSSIYGPMEDSRPSLLVDHTDEPSLVHPADCPPEVLSGTKTTTQSTSTGTWTVTDTWQLTRLADADDDGVPDTGSSGGCDNQAPTVVSTTPKANATGVSRSKTIKATFSEEMNPNTLTASTVKLHVYNKNRQRWVAVTNKTVDCDSPCTIVELDPYGTSSTLLGANKKYRVTITTAVEDKVGNALARNKVWTFTTGSS